MVGNNLINYSISLNKYTENEMRREGNKKQTLPPLKWTKENKEKDAKNNENNCDPIPQQYNVIHTVQKCYYESNRFG